MVAAYTPDRLRDMVRTAYSHLRSRGERHPRLEETLAARARRARPQRLDAAARTALAELAVAGRRRDGREGDRGIEKRERDQGQGEGAVHRRVRGVPRGVHGPPDARAGGARAPRPHDAARAARAATARATTAAKRERSGLDFEDLELVARDLLRGDEGLREAYSSRFEHVLVDEFQDTNRLQNELLALLSRENLFRVGDENQSIYRFRNADVSVFREHWEEARAAGAPRASPSTSARAASCSTPSTSPSSASGARRSSRSARRPASRDAPPKVEPCVDLLVVDRGRDVWKELAAGGDPFGEATHGVPLWRAAEARLLAKRVDELTTQGPWDYGDVVMLFRATTAMGIFERALEERGIPVHVVGGRGYWGQQQVADLRHWLAALANPLDGLALYSVLASPLAGLSLDAVALIGLRARRSRRGPWRTVREPDEELLEALPAAGPLQAGRLRRPLRGGAAHRRPGVARDAHRPRRDAHGLRHARARPAGRHAADGQRAEADADGARVRGRRGPRPARLHRRGRGARRDPGPRGRGAARGGGRGASA